MLAGIVRQLSQSPGLPTAKLPMGAFDLLSRRTSTSPLTPPAAPDATLATNCLAADEENSTPEKRSPAPLPIQPTYCPPPALAAPAVCTPDCGWNASASICR